MSTEIEKDHIILSANSLVEVQNCLQQWDYSKNHQLTLPETGEPLESGNLLHQMLAHFYTAIREDQRSGKESSSYDKKIQAAVMAGYSAAADMELDPEQTIFQFQEYCDHSRADNWEIIGVEQPFSRVIYEDENIAILFEGKKDLVIVQHPQGIKIVVDHKRVSQNRAANPLRDQFIGYAWDENIPNVMINNIGFQKTLKRPDRMVRQMLSYEQPIIDEWVADVVYWGFTLLRHIKANYYPRNRTSCDKFNGCIYRRLCETIPEAREHKMLSFYRKKEAHDLFHEKQI